MTFKIKRPDGCQTYPSGSDTCSYRPNSISEASSLYQEYIGQSIVREGHYVDYNDHTDCSGNDHYWD